MVMSQYHGDGKKFPTWGRERTALKRSVIANAYKMSDTQDGGLLATRPPRGNDSTAHVLPAV